MMFFLVCISLFHLADKWVTSLHMARDEGYAKIYAFRYSFLAIFYHLVTFNTNKYIYLIQNRNILGKVLTYWKKGGILLIAQTGM